MAIGSRTNPYICLGWVTRVLSSGLWRDSQYIWLTICAVIVSTFLKTLLYGDQIAVASPRTLVAALHREGFGKCHVYACNYVLVPLLEESVFWRQFNHLYSYRSNCRNLLSKILFALANVYHVCRVGLAVILFRITYNFLFGIYLLMLDIHVQFIRSSFAAHVVCNILESPDLAVFATDRLKLSSSLDTSLRS